MLIFIIVIVVVKGMMILGLDRLHIFVDCVDL